MKEKYHYSKINKSIFDAYQLIFWEKGFPSDEPFSLRITPSAQNISFSLI